VATGHLGVGAGVAAAFPVTPDLAVLERWIADHLQVHLPLDALHRPHEDVLGLVVRRRTPVGLEVVVRAPVSEGERVADDDPARARHPRGLDDVGARLVATAHRSRQTGRSYPPVPRAT